MVGGLDSESRGLALAWAAGGKQWLLCCSLPRKPGLHSFPPSRVYKQLPVSLMLDGWGKGGRGRGLRCDDPASFPTGTLSNPIRLMLRKQGYFPAAIVTCKNCFLFILSVHHPPHLSSPELLMLAWL